MTVASTLLRQARLSAGASSRALARQAGTAPARISEIERSVHDPGVDTLERTLRSIGWQLLAAPTRSPSAAAVALAIRDSTSPTPASESDQALRALLTLSDGLAAVDPATRVALCAAPAPETGDDRIDAAIAAVVEHHLEPHGPVPGWVHEPERYLSVPWIPDPFAGPDISSEASPAFQRHGVLLAERELASV